MPCIPPSSPQEISERDAWKLEPCGKYFFTRNMSAVAAFCVAGPVPGGGGVPSPSDHALKSSTLGWDTSMALKLS
jgi:hypothetical protein